MFLRVFVLGGLMVLALAACGGEPPTVGEARAFGAVCEEANAGKRVAVDGFLRLPASFSGDESVMLQLYETEAYEGALIGVSTRIGSEANQMEAVPAVYSDWSLKVHLADGQVAGWGTPVRVSGKVYFPIVEQAFGCGLENPLFEQVD